MEFQKYFEFMNLKFVNYFDFINHFNLFEHLIFFF